MKVILLDDRFPECAEMKCECGEEFWVDACTEENLVFNGKALVEVCPACKKVNER